MPVRPRPMLVVPALLLLGVGASWAGWVGSTVAAGGTYNSIAVDSFGHPHIAFLDDSDANDYKLMRAFVDAQGKSHIETVDSGDVGWHCAIAVDSAGHVHVAYHADKPASSLKYAYFDGSQWLMTTVDDGGWANSIALDANGRPHIVYIEDALAGTLKHAWYDGSNWDDEEIATGVVWFGRTGLGITAGGELHVSYSDDSLPRKLFHATNETGSWVSEEIGSGTLSSLALDPNGRPRILSFDEARFELVYRAFDGMSWSSLDVASTGEAGALALDAQGMPHITYGYTTVGATVLAYATWDPASQAFDTILFKGNGRGHDNAIALDQFGLPHLTTRREIGASSQLNYFELVKPDVSVAWGTVTSAPAGHRYRVRANLTVSNGGTGMARQFKVSFYLSDDDVPDAGDLPIGKSRNVPVIRPGDEAEIPLNIRSKTPLSGKYLIAVVSAFDPALEINANNNTGAALIP